MVRTPSTTIRALVPILSGLLWSVAADAQQGPFVPPPIRPSVDENGVELVSGQLLLSRTDIVVGQPGAGGLSFGVVATVTNNTKLNNTRWYSGAVTIQTGPTDAIYTVSLGGFAESFSKANTPSTSPFVSIQGRGSTLTQNSTSFTYRSPDGAVALFSKSLFVWIGGDQSSPANITQLALPDGEIRTYSYVAVTGCNVINCATTGTINRLQSVTNNRGCVFRRSRAAVPADARPSFRGMPGRCEAVGELSSLWWSSSTCLGS